MTVDIRFGTLEETDDGVICTWGGKEDPEEVDGTSTEFTVFSGTPMRSFSNRGYWEWTRKHDTFSALHHAMKPMYPDSNDSEWVYVRDVVHLIDVMPELGECDTDRVRWFKYWSRRAIDEFGGRAVIYVW